MTDFLRQSVVLVALLFVSGCGSNNNVDVYPVRGTVNFEGQPMQGGGSIAFIPKGGQVGKGAGGIIAKDGTYTLGTYSEKDGSMAGEFTVVISQEVASEPMSTEDGTPAVTTTTETVKPEDRIPLTYGRTDVTTLTATVEPKSENVIDFDLKK